MLFFIPVEYRCSPCISHRLSTPCKLGSPIITVHYLMPFFFNEGWAEANVMVGFFFFYCESPPLPYDVVP